jgi:hypothetical protein
MSVPDAKCTYCGAFIGLFFSENAPIDTLSRVSISFIKMLVLTPVRMFFRISFKNLIPVINGKKAAVPHGRPRQTGVLAATQVNFAT